MEHAKGMFHGRQLRKPPQIDDECLGFALHKQPITNDQIAAVDVDQLNSAAYDEIAGRPGSIDIE
jgi:hypothetical protein